MGLFLVGLSVLPFLLMSTAAGETPPWMNSLMARPKRMPHSCGDPGGYGCRKERSQARQSRDAVLVALVQGGADGRVQRPDVLRVDGGVTTT